MNDSQDKRHNRKPNIKKINSNIKYILITNMVVIIFCVLLDHSSQSYILGSEFFFCAILEYRTTILSIFMTIWGIVITITIFWAGKLDNLIYGISLRQIIGWKLSSSAILQLSAMYCLMFPLMLIITLLGLPITQFSLLILMFCNAAVFALFVLKSMNDNNIQELIKYQSLSELEEILNTISNESIKQMSEHELEQLSAQKLGHSIENLPVCISICNADYENGKDRKYILDLLTEISIKIKERMITGEKCTNPQFHILLFPLLHKLVIHSGTKNLNKYRRTKLLLCDLILRIIDNKAWTEKKIQPKDRREADTLIDFIIIAAAIYCYPQASFETDIDELLHTLPWDIRPFIVFLLLEFIEYLYAGGDINYERLNSFARYISDIYPIADNDTYYIENARLNWYIWNHYGFGYWKTANSNYLKSFLAEYNKLRIKSYFGKSYVINQIKYGARDTWRAF